MDALLARVAGGYLSSFNEEELGLIDCDFVGKVEGDHDEIYSIASRSECR
jgi:hypothetical protein